MGYFGIIIPEEYGGMGLGVFEYCLITEELARGWMSVASIIARGNGMGARSRRPRATARDLLARCARGEYIGAVAISEPDVGSDLGDVQCRAERDGDEWVITGNKYWCTLRRRRRLHPCCSRAPRPEPGEARQHGLTCFSSRSRAASFPRAHRQPDPEDRLLRHEDLRARTSTTARAGDDSCRGEEGKAFDFNATRPETARAHTAARAIGLARGALEDAIAYAKERVQFGEPIADFQAIRFKLADMATEIEAARQLM